MRERAISAVVIAAVVIVVFLLGQPWLTFGIAALLALAATEVFRLLPPAGFPVRLLPGALLPPVAVLAMGLELVDAGWLAVYVAAVLVVLAIDALPPTRGPRRLPGLARWQLRRHLPRAAGVHGGHPRRGARGARRTRSWADFLSAGQTWLLVLVLTVWSFDTFAYLAGRTFKRGRFLNHISPNKTWSGVIGGTVAAIVVAGALAGAAGQWLPGGLLLGLVVAVAGQAGDVAESMLKRTAGPRIRAASSPVTAASSIGSTRSSSRPRSSTPTC